MWPALPSIKNEIEQAIPQAITETNENIHQEIRDLGENLKKNWMILSRNKEIQDKMRIQQIINQTKIIQQQIIQ